MRPYLWCLFWSGSVLAQSDCGDGRYTNYAYFDSVSVSTGVLYGSNLGTSGTAQNLYMDIYEPQGDTVAHRPAVLVGFGGSFIGGSRADVADLCLAFAKLGYVSIAFDYRVGFFWPTELTTTKAVMRCAHDIRGCVRYLRKTVVEEGDPYRIDTARIVIGGVSAGAIGALHAAYLDRSYEIPEVLWPDTATLGGIEGNSGSPGYSSGVLACYSFSGALGDTSWIVAGDEPLCSVHETADEVVPCWTEEVEVIGIATGLMASGSGDIHRRMDHQGVPNCLTIYPGNGHVGYLNYDAQASFDRVVQFLADAVCTGAEGCTPLYVGVEHPLAIGERPLIAPDPTTGVVALLNFPKGAVYVIDPRGAIVHRAVVESTREVIDLTSLPAGVYVVRYEDPRGISLPLVKL
jgi:acetyl esterase/lipase